MITSQNKFAFFGTPRIAAEILEILKQNGYLPSLIITSPDKPVGRKQIITPPPVKIWAQKNNVPVLQPEKLNKEEIEIALKTLSQGDGPRRAIRQQANTRGLKSNFDFFAVVAYGKILPKELIGLPKYGTLNLHYSLLPKYRGASPVEAAILAGEKETGVAIQQMEFKLDSGPILAEARTSIGPDETALELEARLTELGGNLLVKTLPDFLAGRIVPRPQDDSAATFCKKIKKEDGEIHPPPHLVTWSPSEGEMLWRKYRAYAGWPGLYFFADKNGKKIRVLIKEAEFKDGAFLVKKVLPEGKKIIDFMTFQRF